MQSTRASSPVKRLVHVDFGDKLVSYDWALNLQQTLRSLHKNYDVPDLLLQLQVRKFASMCYRIQNCLSLGNTNKGIV